MNFLFSFPMLKHVYMSKSLFLPAFWSQNIFKIAVQVVGPTFLSYNQPKLAVFLGAFSAFLWVFVSQNIFRNGWKRCVIHVWTLLGQYWAIKLVQTQNVWRKTANNGSNHDIWPISCIFKNLKKKMRVLMDQYGHL